MTKAKGRCRHDREYRLDRAIFRIDFDVVTAMRTWWADGMRIAECVANRCTRCGAWLSLGPANDSSEAVDIEIEAARLAAMPRVSLEQWPSEMAGQEPHGWLGHKHDDDPIDPHYTYWAGWLAREIAEHGPEAA